MNLPDRFLEKVTVTDSCWLWNASINSYGYGRFKWDGDMMAAHRFSWAYVNGEIPDGMSVLHNCDVRNCVNPDHLFLGTHQDNMNDMKAKHREARGENHGNSKLTDSIAGEIRRYYKPGIRGKASPHSMRGLAKTYNVDVATIKKIIHNRAWVS